MKIVLAGGSGQIGSALARAFVRGGNTVVVLSRRPAGRRTDWRVVPWDPRELGPWTAEIEGSDVVINLAGRSVDCRYSQGNRREILDSRVASTRILGQAISRAKRPPRVWLQSGTATIYAHRYDAPNDEISGILDEPGPSARDSWRFSVEVARAWEDALGESALPHTRKVLLRISLAMTPDPGGVFAVLSRLARLGLGGRAGDGRQYVSWIHEQDLIAAVLWLIDRQDVSGPVNLASPAPLPNDEFMRLLRRAWGARLGLPASPWMLELGAFLLRTETELLLKSRRVVPGVLLSRGFAFGFPTWAEAARDLAERSRTRKPS